MIRARTAVVALLAVFVAACAVSAAERVQVVPSHARVRPGGTLQMRAVPPTETGAGSLPANFRTFWKAFGGGVIDSKGFYRAPYIVAPPGMSVQIIFARGVKGSLDSAATTLELEPGALPGSEECLGPGQKWAEGGLWLDAVQLDELPEPIKRVTPEYPRSVAARDLKGSLMVNALVCRDGHVLDTYATWGTSSTPVPELEDLAVSAARQWTFKPGTVAGHAMATMVAIPFVFPPR